MNRLTAVLIGVLLLAGAAQAAVAPYVDFWANTAYLTTNGERNNYNAFNLRSEGKFGLAFTEFLPGMKLVPYVAYYGIASSSDPNYWNNQVAYGGGLRVMPLSGVSPEGWALEWLPDVKLFYEKLGLSFLKDEQTAIANSVKTTDTRWGLDLWHEWNLKNPNPELLWDETWFNLSYRETDFATFNFYRTYLLYWQNKIGLHSSMGLRPYIATYLTSSGRSEEWYNSLYYGLGIRVEPFLEMSEPPEILRKFKMFIEVLGISWLKGNTTNRPSQDVRLGIDFTYGR